MTKRIKLLGVQTLKVLAVNLLSNRLKQAWETWAVVAQCTKMKQNSSLRWNFIQRWMTVG